MILRSFRSLEGSPLIPPSFLGRGRGLFRFFCLCICSVGLLAITIPTYCVAVNTTSFYLFLSLQKYSTYIHM